MGQLSTDLIASVRRRARLPNNQALLSDADIVAIANEAMLASMAPFIVDCHEEFLVRSMDYTIGTTRSFRIPSRAMKVREVLLVSSSGQMSQVARLRIDQQPYMADGFELRGNNLIITDGAAQGATKLRIVYYVRPSALVTTTSQTTTSIGTVGGQVSVSGVGAVVGSRYDILRPDSPYEHVMDAGICSTSLGAGAYTFVDDTGAAIDLSSVLSGFLFADAGTASVVQVPSDLFPVFCQMTAVECLRQIGDKLALKDAADELARMMNDAGATQDDRIEGEQVKIFNADLFGGF